MSLFDYQEPRTRRIWRVVAGAAFLLGVIGLAIGYRLTLEVIRTSVAHPDATHSFAVMDRYYVSAELGFKRNLILILSAVTVVTAAVVLLHREIRWYFWERYLPPK